jgi:hypothetical protein
MTWVRRRKRNHRWPRRSESVIDYERDDRGPYGRGQVIHVDKENKQVLVRFFLPPEAHHARWVLVYSGDVLWSGSNVRDPSYVDLNAQSELATCDQLITTQSYEFDDLKWSSHVGGVGAWITRRYNP